jgi:hypothetical protein
MAQPQNNVSITAPGFAGLNTQDSPLDMDPSFASVADNCTIDNYGRISSRRGFQYVTANPDILTDNPIRTLAEFVNEIDGETTLFACGNNAIYIQELETPPLDLTAQVLPEVPTGDDWQIVQFNNKMYFTQSGHNPLVWTPVDGVTPASFDLLIYNTGPDVINAVDGQPNCCHAAFGRLWLGDFDANSTVVAWSGILNGEQWDSGGAGTMQTSEYWPSGYDEVTALAAHNNFMVIYGLNNILLYQTTSDVVNTLTLVDTIEGIGCLARDSVVPTGTDFMFIDSTGVRSLNRTIQEKSVPIGDISMNVRNEFQMALRIEPNKDIKAVYHNEDSFYSCFLPSNPKTYVFDTWNPLPTGAARASVWTNIIVRCGVRTRVRQTYFGGTGGVFNYAGAEDVVLTGTSPTYVEEIQSIPMRYFTHPMDFGSAANLIFPKQVDVTLIGGLTGDLAIQWAYDYKSEVDSKSQPISATTNPSYFNATLITEGAEWSDPINSPATVGQIGYWTGEIDSINQLKYNIWGSGRNVRIGFATDIVGSTVSIQELNVQVLQGRIL